MQQDIQISFEEIIELVPQFKIDMHVIDMDSDNNGKECVVKGIKLNPAVANYVATSDFYQKDIR